jgi:outer membrane protein assembly factor BamB
MNPRKERLWRSCVGSSPRQRCARFLLVAAIAILLSHAGHAQDADGKAAQRIGWRTDGTGSYPKAQPPLEWSATKNVVWCTPMPGYGVSHPVLLGQRVFTCSEPATLLCVNRDDGKVLWQKTCSYAELEIEPELREQIKKELAELAELNKKQSAVQKEMDTLHRSLVKDKATKEEIDDKLKPFRTQIDNLNKQKQQLTLGVRYTEPRTHSAAGYSAPTPVTNGREIFVAFGNGLVACYDLEGNRKWLKLIEHSNLAFAHSGSPILIGDKLVIQFTDLVALDPKTGKEAWRLKFPAAWGTPLPTRIGDVDVILTPKGGLVRARDGKLLADRLGSCGANSPVLHERTVYFAHGAVNAIRLPASLTEPLKPDIAWKGKVKGGGYGFSSPVIHEGLLYAASDQGILTVLDTATGQMVYEERLNLGGAIYPSISLAGNRLYVSSDNGSTVVLQPGREYKVLARNKLETFRSSLVFEGKRVYIRTQKHLYCIGE